MILGRRGGPGEIGQPGQFGAPGDTGATGFAGSLGFPGGQGWTGQPGQVGRDGLPGFKGVAGFTGFTGILPSFVHCAWFLATLHFLIAITNQSVVCLSSVTFVCYTQEFEIFSNISSPGALLVLIVI